MKGRLMQWTRFAAIAVCVLAVGNAKAQGAAASSPAAPATPATASAQPQKVLRYAFRVAETGFDPAQLSDLYSRTITPHIFEAPYHYDHLARPIKIKPLTADGMPSHSDDFRVWTVKLQPGIYFASDPAFKGKKRELVAQDYVYSFMRFADPATKAPAWGWLDSTFGFLGLAERRRQAVDRKKPFDYDTPLEGIRALDRYTVQFRLPNPNPRFIPDALAASDILGAVAREVVEAYPDQTMAHPVGTGPFKLVQWRRSSFIALERNPDYREVLYSAEPAADDAEGQAVLATLKGRRLPMVDRVEVSIIEESQPRWLSFLQNNLDVIEEVPPEFIGQAMPGGKVAPNLAKLGMKGYRMVRADAALTFFNMEDPVVGGYTPDKVALRRAIFLGVDVEREIRMVRNGQAIPGQSPVAPHLFGYDPQFKSESGTYDVPRAKALLDMFGYVDKDGDGWRDQPNGQPLLLRKSTQPDQQSRQLDEQWRRDMQALNIRIEFVTAKWPENLKAARAGKLMMWGVGSLASTPDGQGAFQRLNSKQIGGQNLARFKMPAMDAIYDQMSALPDGPERLALFAEAKRMAVVYAPYKTHVHRMVNDLVQPWVIGYRRPIFWSEWWQYVDIDTRKLPAH